MCSNDDRNVFGKSEFIGKVDKTSKYYYQPRQSASSSTSNSNRKNSEQTYYAKLINVNQSQQQKNQGSGGSISRNSLQRRNCVRGTAYPTRRLTDNYLNAKLAEYLNEADYEALMNFDSVLETVTIPKVGSPSSTSANKNVKIANEQLNYSNEDEDIQKYFELEKFHSSLKKNIKKSTSPPELTKPDKSYQFNLANNKRLDTNSVGSFSSSSASSISSQSSAANSSTSSSSSSPLLSSNFLSENNSAIYSTNYKVRNRIDEINNITNQSASPIPTPPSSQPPSLTKNADLKLIKSQSAIITKTTMSAWLHPTTENNQISCSSNPTSTPEANYDDYNSCVYSELTDSISASDQLDKPNVMTLKKTTTSTSKLKQYDSSLLTPLKAKNVAYSTRTPTSPIRSNSTTNIKSASTSYLLSKITSIASQQKSANSSPPLEPIQNQQNTLSSLANKTSKFFHSRKSLNQIQHYDEISSTSSNSISATSPVEMISLDKVKLASSSSASSNASVTSSRRGFIKKRSQSTHSAVNKEFWMYNKNLDFWILLTKTLQDEQKTDFISSTLRKTKRKSNNKINDYMNTMLDQASSQDCLKLRLTGIELKYLTQVELKYLKQICFNKLKLELENQVETVKTPNRKQSLGSTSSSDHPHLSAIPKDESLKCTKTKNIALRSKSVDFKFFDELKENYFSRKSIHPLQVFGQTLYKCILNDLQRLPAKKSVNHGSVNANTITKRWRSSNQNVLIASKLDLNILANKRPPTAQKQEDPVNKRNSVLFEALDLKNVKNLNKNNQPILTPVLSGHKPRLSSSRNRLIRIDSPTPSVNNQSIEASDAQGLNQNLSIRSEGLVPNIVKSCCKHISEYGLDLVGIFRIDSSKKRIKEIKEMYDTGKDVVMNEQFNPNDSACVLKEYLRSLPEPLLTRDLYSSFLAASKIKDADKKLQVIRLLICLLPVPNRDTLQMLLNLLDKVRANSCIQLSSDSNSNKTEYTGNKMDSFNLAMVFGPNLLKKSVGNGQISARGLSSGKLNDYSSDKYNLIDDIDSVISVTKYLIENQNDLFQIESSIHNELIETINNINPVEVNSILTRKQISSFGVSVLKNETTEYLNITPTPSEPQSLASSPHSIQFSTNTSCSSVSSSNQLLSHNLTPEQTESATNTKFLNYLNADFIDNNTKQFTRQKVSRTKLHKIVDNFNYLNCVDNMPSRQQPIHFASSPTHSPINNKGVKKPSVRQLKKHSVESSMNHDKSSLLLMIQNDQNSRPKVTNENKKSVSTKSMSNLTQISKNQTAGNETNTARRQSSSNLKNQYNMGGNSNSNTIHKFYDKTKYNIIGEQETLV